MLVTETLYEIGLSSSHAFSSGGSVSLNSDFHLRPRYPAQLPLESTLLKTDAGLDRFVTERYQDRIARISRIGRLSCDSSRQQCIPSNRFLVLSFQDSRHGRWAPRVLRSSAALEVRENKFARQSGLRADEFVGEFGSLLGSLSKVETAEFQIVAIEASGSGASTSLHTSVRYELVGTGRDFHREQRVGEWQLEWASSHSGLFSAESSKPRRTSFENMEGRARNS